MAINNFLKLSNVAILGEFNGKCVFGVNGGVNYVLKILKSLNF